MPKGAYGDYKKIVFCASCRDYKSSACAVFWLGEIGPRRLQEADAVSENLR